MARTKKQWVYAPQKQRSSTQVSASVKQQIKQQADELIESVLKPKYIKSPLQNPEFNYLVDLFSQWVRHYFYFCSKYHSPGPHAISPSFEMKFARLEYVSENNFKLSYMRHTDQWFEIYEGLSLEKCLELIEGGPHFMP
jgi:hypothetical protein